MNETRSLSISIRRLAVPLLVAALLVAGTVIISGSHLIQTEDVVLNRILAGTYGTPDWRVQEMNPLLALFVTLLYQITGAVNWYGAMLLVLLLLAAATGISLASRRKGGLLPAIIVVSPIVVLLTNSMVSTAVAVLCAAAGAFSLMDGLAARKQGIGRAIWGGVLFALGAMLSLWLAVCAGLCIAVCWLPGAVRESRLRGVLIGLPVLAIVAAALFGFTALMYSSPELSAYRNDYARYERLQHSSLRQEVYDLLDEYGEVVVADGEHDHVEGEGELPTGEIPPNSFDALGWTLNDASLFVSRFGSDAQIVDPDALRTLESEASFWNFSPGRLWDELLATLKKPQFLMLIGLLVISALVTVVTSRGKGLVALLAVLIAFGGHILMLAHYYDTFASIAPWYLLGIVILLYSFNGEDASAWIRRLLASPWLRTAAGVLVLAVFVAGMGGILYYLRITPVNVDMYTLQALEFLKPYIAEHPEILYIGDNPNERTKPDTLQAPVRGEDASMLAGSYDLYSPRYAALMEQFEITNPLPDSVDRDDIAYIMMGFVEPASLRLASAYNIYAKEPNVLVSKDTYADTILNIRAFTEEEVQALLAQAAADSEQAAMWAQALAEMEAQGLLDDLAEDDHDHDDHDHEAEDHDHEEEAEDHDHGEEAEATASPTVAPTATPTAAPTATATPATGTGNG